MGCPRPWGRQGEGAAVRREEGSHFTLGVTYAPAQMHGRLLGTVDA